MSDEKRTLAIVWNCNLCGVPCCEHARAELASVRAERDLYRGSLEAILRHQEITAGTMASYSTVAAICRRALAAPQEKPRE